MKHVFYTNNDVDKLYGDFLESYVNKKENNQISPEESKLIQEVFNFIKEQI